MLTHRKNNFHDQLCVYKWLHDQVSWIMCHLLEPLIEIFSKTAISDVTKDKMPLNRLVVATWAEVGMLCRKGAWVLDQSDESQPLIHKLHHKDTG